MVGDKRGTLFVKSLYFVLEPRRSMPFLVGVVWNGWVPPKVSFFFFLFFGFEGVLGKSFDFRSTSKESWMLSN